MPPAKLAWTHFLKASMVGFLLLPIGGGLVGFVQAWNGQLGYPRDWGLDLISSLATAGAWLMSTAIWGSIFLGIPALLFGLFRLPLMGLLFRTLRLSDWRGNLLFALLGTAVIFELPLVLLAGLAPFKSLYAHPVVLFCLGVSLPWLIGSLWATWSLRRELGAS